MEKRTGSWILRLVTLAALVALVPGAIFFAMSRPEAPPHETPAVEYPDEVLDPLVGLYELAGNERVLLTYSARGGLAMYGLNGSRFSREDYLSSSIVPSSDGTYAWEPFEDGPTRRLRPVTKGEYERVTGIEWEDETGHTGSASKLAASFSQREVTWSNGDLQLTGTLFLPATPAIGGAVILHGSGFSDRDNLWYLHFVVRLVESGVATLFPDKRGCGKSRGDWRSSTFEELAFDGLTARNRLAEWSGLEPGVIGFVGMSEGGSSVAPSAAALADDLPFIVSVSGSNAPMKRLLSHETTQNLRQMGVPRIFDFFMHPYAMAIAQRKRRRFWELNGGYDPQLHWSRTDVPLLVLYGRDDEDDNVPVLESVRRFEALGREDVRVKVYDGVGHGLFDPATREIVPDALDSVVDWIVQSTVR